MGWLNAGDMHGAKENSFPSLPSAYVVTSHMPLRHTHHSGDKMQGSEEK